MGFPRKITELPLRTIIKNTDLIVSVDVDTNLTNKVTLESLATFIGDENQYVTGGTYNEITESINFVGNGGFPPFSVNVSGLTEDTYVTGATLNVAILEIGRNNGEPLISIDLSSLSGDTNTFVSGATLVGTTYILEKNDGTTIPTDFEPIISGKLDKSNFNVYSANTETEIESKLDKSNFDTYSANTETEIESKLDKSNFDTYSANTQTEIESKLDKSNFDTYSANTQTEIDSKLDKSNFNVYSANTQTEIDSKISNGVNFGGANEIFSGKSGNDLYFKTLSGGSNTTLTNVGDVVKIDVTIPADTNTFVTGTSLNNTTYTINQNDGSTFPTDFEPLISGFTSGNTLQEVIENGSVYSGTDIVQINTSETIILSSNIMNTFVGFGLNNSGTTIVYEDTLLNNKRELSITDTELLITDEITDKGVEYADDYSSNFTNRSLVDKEYVDGVVNDKVDTSLFNTYTANTETEINSKLDITTFDNYTANTIDNNIFVSSGEANAATQQLTFTNTSGGTFNVTNAAALFSDNDINVTGGTYDNNTGCVTFTTNSGTTFPICGFITGLTDTYTSTGVYDNNTGEITFTRTDASTYTVDLSTLDLNDKFVSGGTYNSGTTSFDFVGNNGFPPFSVGVQPLISPFEFGTGVDAVQPRDSSYNNSTQNTVWLGGTVNKIMGDYNFIGNGLNHSIEASADYSFIGNGNNNQLGDGVNFLSYSAILAGKDNTIEGTVSNSAIIAGENNTITHSNTFILGSNISSTQTGTTYVENLNVGSLGSGISVNNLGVDTNGNVVVGSSGTSSTDTFVTGSTLNGDSLTIRRNDGVDIVVTGFSQTFTGNTNTTCIGDIYVSNIHSCSPLNINPNDEGNVYFGSTSGVTIDVNNSKLGIGTDAPDRRLEVNGTKGKLEVRLDNDNGNNTNQLLLTSDEDTYTNFMSIGTTTLNAELQFGMVGPSSTSKVVGLTDDSFILATSASDNMNFINNEGTGTSDNIGFYAGKTLGTDLSATTSDIMILGDGSNRGYVGIGTNTPNAKLQINYDDTAERAFRILNTNDNSQYNFRTEKSGTEYLLRFDSDNSGISPLVVSSASKVGVGTNGLVPEATLHVYSTSGSQPIVLVEDETNPDITPFIIDTDGNVGIGTNIPTDKLEVSGNTKISGTLNIGTVGTTTSVNNLGVDTNGNVVVGSSGTSFTDTFVVSGEADAATQQLTFTNTTGGTFNVTNSAALFSDNDINVTGGTYDNNTGCVTFFTNSGTSFPICGFVTGLTDTYTSSGTYDNNTAEITFSRTDASTYTVDLSTLDLNDKFITGFTYNDNNTLTITDNEDNSFSATINEMSGLTINGDLTVNGEYSTMNVNEFSVTISGDNVFSVGQLNTQNVKIGEIGISDKVDIGGKEVTIDTEELNLNQTLTQNNSETQLLVRNSTSGNVEYRDVSTITGGTSGGSSPYTTKAGGDVINWDYSTDGPNIKVTLSGDASNVLTVDSVSEFPNGTSGFIIIDPSLSTDYKLPDENYGSDTGIKSYLSAADAALGGTNPVRLHYTYDGTSFWFDKFTNMIEPIYPPSVDFDTNDLIAFYHPESFNQSVSGGVSGGFAVPNISSSILIGDLAIGGDATNFDFTVRDDSINQPAFWTMGDDENEIITPSTLGATIDTNNTVSFYMKGDYQTGYCGLIDFYDGSGIYEETLYLYNKFFRSYDPSFTFSYAELLDYSGDGGADLTSEWLFVSYSIDENNNELTLYVGCQSSLDAARAASGATNWDYSGLGDTVSVDANGLYSETASVTIDETTFDRFYYGNSAGSGEGALCSLGMLGIYSSVIPSSQVLSNWESTRSTYYIT